MLKFYNKSSTNILGEFFLLNKKFFYLEMLYYERELSKFHVINGMLKIFLNRFFFILFFIRKTKTIFSSIIDLKPQHCVTFLVAQISLK